MCNERSKLFTLWSHCLTFLLVFFFFLSFPPSVCTQKSLQILQIIGAVLNGQCKLISIKSSSFQRVYTSTANFILKLNRFFLDANQPIFFACAPSMYPILIYMGQLHAFSCYLPSNLKTSRNPIVIRPQKKLNFFSCEKRIAFISCLKNIIIQKNSQ